MALYARVKCPGKRNLNPLRLETTVPGSWENIEGGLYIVVVCFHRVRLFDLI